MTALILPGQLDVPLRDRLRLAYDFTSLRERSRGVSPTAFYGAVGPGSFGMPSGNAGFQLPPGSFSPQRLTIVCRFRRNDFNSLENHFLTADSYSISQRSFQFRLSGDTVQLIGFVSGSPLTVGGDFYEAYRDVPLTVGVTHDGTTTTILGLHGSNLATLYSGTGIGSPLDVTGAYPGVGVGWANASTAYDTTRSTTHRYLLAWDAALPLNDLCEVMRDPGAAFQGRRILYFNVAGGGAITGSGTPAAQSATVAGTATRTITGSGAPSAQAAIAAGTAEREITGSGAPVSQYATVAGTGSVSAGISGSGVLSAQSATVAGTATRTVTASGTPSAQSATVAGTAEREVTGSGTPTAQSATVVGTGQIGNIVTGSGAPAAQSATVAGTAEREITSSGAVSAQSATVAGAGVRVITGTGSPTAQDATVYGYDVAPQTAHNTGGGGSRKMLLSERKVRDEVDEWLKKKREQEMLARIQREDEELVLILALVA